MLLNSHTLDERCSGFDYESDNFSDDSLENEPSTSKLSKTANDKAYKICLDPAYKVSMSLKNSQKESKQNYGNDNTNYWELRFDSDMEHFTEATLSKVDIILPSASIVKENEKTKFERKSVSKAFQRRRTQSASRSRYQKEYNQTSDKETVNVKDPSNHLPRSVSSDSASLQAHTSHRSPVRKPFMKVTPQTKTNKRSNLSYLAQYRGQNPHSQAQDSEDRSMMESPSQVSVITSQDDESQFYSDIINGRISAGGQSECDLDGDQELKSVSEQDLKSVSEVQFDSCCKSGLSYVPYTAKDHLLVVPTRLGSLGPDPSTYKEKAESCKKRQQYGMFASLKNMELIRHRNLKKKISEAIADLQESSTSDDVRADEPWDSKSNSHSSQESAASRLEVSSRSSRGSEERAKKEPKQGLGKCKKKLPASSYKASALEKASSYDAGESNLDLINKLLRDRHKNELIINTF